MTDETVSTSPTWRQLPSKKKRIFFFARFVFFYFFYKVSLKRGKKSTREEKIRRGFPPNKHKLAIPDRDPASDGVGERSNLDGERRRRRSRRSSFLLRCRRRHLRRCRRYLVSPRLRLSVRQGRELSLDVVRQNGLAPERRGERPPGTGGKRGRRRRSVFVVDDVDDVDIVIAAAVDKAGDDEVFRVAREAKRRQRPRDLGFLRSWFVRFFLV